MEKQKVIITQELQQALAAEIAACQPDRLFVLTDENTLTSTMGMMSERMDLSPMASSVFWSMMAMRGIMKMFSV